jgi:glucosamine--fructose-6-phosphate aminotransferase (isomerizing)
MARKQGRMTSEVIRTHLQRLAELPEALARFIDRWDRQAQQAAERLRNAKTFLYLGRGVHYAIAREAALKLKEISYIHAEGYPAGELKHGPSALLDEETPVVALATCDRSDPDSLLRYQKTLAIMEEVKRRHGKLLAVAVEGAEEVREIADIVFMTPEAPELLLPILEVVPLQLFAYHMGVLSGADVDNPRNLVKAVVRE